MGGVEVGVPGGGRLPERALCMPSVGVEAGAPVWRVLSTQICTFHSESYFPAIRI